MASRKQPKGEIPNLPTMIKGEALPKAPDAAYVARLVVIKGNEEGAEHLVRRGTTLIGRAADSDLPLTDLASSRKHVNLVWETDSLRLVDLGSGNGTVLNGKRVTQTTLKHGDVIEIGGTQIRVEVFAPSEDDDEHTQARSPMPEPSRKPPSAVALHLTVGLPGLAPSPQPAPAPAPLPRGAAERAAARGSGSATVAEGTEQAAALAGLLPPVPGGVLPPIAGGGGQLPGPFGQKSSLSHSDAVVAPSFSPAPFSPAPAPIAPAAPLSSGRTGAAPVAPAPLADSKPPGLGEARQAPEARAEAKPQDSRPAPPESRTPAPAAKVPSAAVAIVTPEAAGPGWARALSGIGGDRRGLAFVGLAVAIAGFAGAALLVVFPQSAGAEAEGIAAFRAGVASYRELDLDKAEAAFTLAAKKTPALTEARDYLQLLRAERAAKSRLDEAKRLTPGADAAADRPAEREQLAVALALERSVPTTSLYATDAAALERETTARWIQSVRAEVEQHLDAKKHVDAARVLLQTQRVLGEVPAGLAELPPKLERAAGVANWHDLVGEPAGAAPIDAAPEPASGAAAPEPAPAEEPKGPAAPEPVALAPAAPAAPAAAPSPAAAPAAAPAPPPEPKEAKSPKEIKDAALTLYKSRKFSLAAATAKKAKTKELDLLAKNIEDFEALFGKAKKDYDSGARTVVYDSLKKALKKDQSVSGGYYKSEILKMLPACSAALAKQYYASGNSGSNSDFARAYSLAQETLAYDKSMADMQKIIDDIDKKAAAKMKEATKLEGKGKNGDAIAAYEVVIAMLPSSQGLHNDAKKAKDRLVKSNPLKKEDR